MSVNLGGRNVGVAEEPLNGADVGAVNQEVGGETVAHGVGADVLGEAGKFGVFFDDTLDGTGGEAQLIVLADVSALIHEEGRGIVKAHGKVERDGIGSLVTDENRTVFLAFTANDEFAFVEVDLIAVQGDEFGDAEAGGKEEGDHGSIALVGWAVWRDGGKDLLDLIDVEEGNLGLIDFGEIDVDGVEAFDFATGEVFEEDAQGNQVIALGAR